jgi:hypothetical protein
MRRYITHIGTAQQQQAAIVQIMSELAWSRLSEISTWLYDS